MGWSRGLDTETSAIDTTPPPTEVPPPLRLIERPRRRRRGGPAGMVANATFSLLSQVVSGVFTAILTLFLVRALGAGDYGSFSLAVSVGTLVAFPADFGVSASAARFVAESRALPTRMAEILADAVRIKAVATIIACGGLALAAPVIARAYNAPLTGPLRIIALAIVGQNFMALFEAAFVGAGRVATNARVAVGESGMECTASVLIVLLGGGLTGAVTGRAAGYVFGAALALVFGSRTFAWSSALGRRAQRPSNVRRILRYAAPLMLVDSATALFAMVDVLLIGAYLGSRDAGLFNAPMRLLNLFFYVGNAVSTGIAPRLARSTTADPDGRALARGLRLLFLFYSIMLAPLVVWAKPITHVLLGGGYTESIPTLRCLSIALYLGGAVPLVSSSATFLGEARLRAPLMIAATLLDALIDVILIPRIGIISGAIATAAAYGVMFAGHFWMCRRRVTLRITPLAISAARGLGAAAVMALPLLAIGAHPSIPVLIGGLVGGAILFVGALVLFREFSRAEIAAVSEWLRSRAARR